MATKTRQLADFLVAGGTSDQVVQSVPHIRPGLLYPSYVASGTSNKLLDGTTNHSGAWGSEQSDGRKYYYTNISGSSPINDPRIGAHYGSQRHMIRSIQHDHKGSSGFQKGTNANTPRAVYKVDGREWFRILWAPNAAQKIQFDTNQFGPHLSWDANSTNSFIEITGYFNEAHFLMHAQGEAGAASRRFQWSIDGGSDSSEIGAMNSGAAYQARYISSHTVFPCEIGTDATLGIHTLKVKAVNSFTFMPMGVELIAQDQGSATRKNQINIPAQRVISYGKNFNIGSDTLTDSVHSHYDPFNGFTNGTTLHSAKVDTATSLGLDHAPGASAKWAISSTNNIRPFNGGRVIKWVANDGTIKTSVNMMPPNSQNLDGDASNEITTPSTTNTHIYNSSDDAIDVNQQEIAKAFWWREFGNGASRTGGGGNWADMSMLLTQDKIGYSMDDALTALHSTLGLQTTGDYGVDKETALIPQGDSEFWVATFIGTGVSIRSAANDGQGIFTIASNLPYGCHLLQVVRDGTNDPAFRIDGFNMGKESALNSYGNLVELIIHQPAKPPIPQDACIIADYMLMADWVRDSETDSEKRTCSKGSRYVQNDRDYWYHDNGANTSWDNPIFGHNSHSHSGYIIYANGNITSGTHEMMLPYFGTHIQTRHYNNHDDAITINGTAASSNDVGSNYGAKQYFEVSGSPEPKIYKQILNDGYWHYNGGEVRTPIHTSYHYQDFETPYSMELVGGDRNMEQMNLIVSGDGKTWDDITRDISYIGPSAGFNVGRDSGDISGSNPPHFNLNRGHVDDNRDREIFYMKDFASNGGYGVVCLIDGYYQVSFIAEPHTNDGTCQVAIKKNSVDCRSYEVRGGSATRGLYHLKFNLNLKRGDILEVHVNGGTINMDGDQQNSFSAHILD